MSLTPLELQVRRPVWTAMSDLFLDTETRWSIPYVGRVCAASGLDDEQLERVFWCEVFPLAIYNLHDIAGEWAMLNLPEPELVERAENPRHDRVLELTSAWMVKRTWEASKIVCRRLRTEPVERALLLQRCWDGFGQPYLEREEAFGTSAPRAGLVEARLAGVDLLAEWRFYRPVLLSVVSEDEEKGGVARDAEVERLIAGV